MAGTSKRGQQFAVTNADMVIAHKNSVEDMRTYSTQLRSQLAAAGRDPTSCKVFFSIKPVMGDSPAMAQEIWARNYENAPPESGLSYLSATLGLDMSHIRPGSTAAARPCGAGHGWQAAAIHPGEKAHDAARDRQARGDARDVADLRHARTGGRHHRADGGGRRRGRLPLPRQGGRPPVPDRDSDKADAHPAQARHRAHRLCRQPRCGTTCSPFEAASRAAPMV